MRDQEENFSASFQGPSGPLRVLKKHSSLQELAANSELHTTQISSLEKEFLKMQICASGRNQKSKYPDSVGPERDSNNKIGQYASWKNDCLKTSLGA